jgi:hypothetical protein
MVCSLSFLVGTNGKRNLFRQHLEKWQENQLVGKQCGAKGTQKGGGQAAGNKKALLLARPLYTSSGPVISTISFRSFRLQRPLIDRQ